MASTADNAFNAFWDTTKTIGIQLLEQKGAAALAEQETKNLIAQQAAYSRLAQQSSNLGPNEVPAANRAAVTETRTLQGTRAIQAIKDTPIFFWVAIVFFGALIVYAIRKK